MEKARLKKAFRYIPGDIIRKEDLNLDDADLCPDCGYCYGCCEC